MNGKTKRDRDPALSWGVPPALEAPEGVLDGGRVRQGPGAVATASRAAFATVAEAHLAALVQQQLVAEGVSSADVWGPVLVKLALQAASSLSPTALTANGNIDPRHYVKVKRVVGAGEPSSSCVVQGVVFRKNVAHKRMRTSIPQAGVLLLAGALEWQPTESKLQQFDTLLNEEQAFLAAAVERIASFSPDVVVVERSVARYAQELLLDRGVALVLNVKRDLLDRIARCTDAEVVPSLAQLTAHSLGFCKEFEVEGLAPAGAAAPQLARVSLNRVSAVMPSTPSSPLVAQQPPAEQGHLVADAAALRKSSTARPGPNSLMLFKGCPRPLGCTILLKGGDARELAKVKRVAAFAAYAAYWNRLESELLADQLASAAAATPAVAPVLWRNGDTLLSKTAEPASTVLASGPGSPTTASTPAAAAAAPLLTSPWAALAAACAEASCRAAAEERGQQPIVSASPHVTFFGGEEQEQEQPSDGAAGGASARAASVSERGAAGEREQGLRSPATTCASVASSPTKSALAASAAGGSSQPPQPPSSVAPAERDQAVVRSLLLTDDSSCSDPWVVPADADGATVTISGHASLSAPTTTSSPLLESPAAAAAAGAAGASAGISALGPGSPQLDPLSQAAREIEQQLAAAAAAEEGGGGSDAEDVASAAAAAPRLPQINTRPGTDTAESSPKAAQRGTVSGTGGAGAAGAEAGTAAAAAAAEPAGSSKAAEVAYSSQRLWVSISCKNPAKGIQCEPPHSHSMQYYAKEDMPLAHFLAAATPTNRKCAHPTCGDGAMLHLRSFMHGDGLVTLSSVRLPAGQELPGRDKGQIWLWLRPLGKDPEAQGDVRRVALSAEGACMSFAHLLCLLLDARHLTLGNQSLQRDYVRYLGAGSTVLCLHHSQVSPYDVWLPPRQVTLSLEAEVTWLLEEVKGLTEEADDAFGTIQYALAQQLQPLEEEDPEFVSTWMSNLAETRGAFMERVHAARADLDARLLTPGGGQADKQQQLQQQQEMEGEEPPDGMVQAVWELNRLRRLLACEVLQWATALHEGTPVARAAPPQATVELLGGKHSRRGSVEMDFGAVAAAGAEPSESQPGGGSSMTAAPSEEGVAASPGAVSQSPSAAGLPPLPPEARPKTSPGGGVQPQDAAAAAATAGEAAATQQQQQQQQRHRRSPSSMRRSSVSLAAHIAATMGQGTPPGPLPPSSANFAPSLRDSEAAAAANLETASSSASTDLPPIPFGLVARYVSVFDDSKPRGGDQRDQQAPSLQAQQRTLDWVQRAAPSYSGTEASAPASSVSGGSGSVPATPAAGAGTPQRPGEPPAQQGSPAAEPSSFYVVVSDDEGVASEVSRSQEEDAEGGGEEEEVERLPDEPSEGGPAAALGRLRRPSMRIDLSHPDPNIVSAFSPRSAQAADGEPQGEERSSGPLTAFERLASRFGRLSLRRSLSERRRNRSDPEPGASKPPGVPTVPEAAEAALPAGTAAPPAAPPAAPAAAPQVVVAAAAPAVPQAVAASPAAEQAAQAPPSGAPRAASAAEPGGPVQGAAVAAEEAAPPASAATESAHAAPEKQAAVEEGVEPEPGEEAALRVDSGGPSVSHFEEWTALLKSGSGPLGDEEAAAVAAAMAQKPAAPAAPSAQPQAAAPPSPTKAASAASASALPAAPAPPPASSAIPPAQPQQQQQQPFQQQSVPPSPAAPLSAPLLPPPAAPEPQKQASKLKQLLLGKLWVEPALGQVPLASAGKVELTGRSLLPPGLDDLHVTIFDEEPTSVIAYFLSTRVYQQFLRDSVASIVSGGSQRGPSSAAGSATAAGSAAAAESGAASEAQPASQSGGAAPAMAEGGPALPSATAAPPPPPQAQAQQQQQQQQQQRGSGGAGAASDRGTDWQVLFSEQRLDCQLSIEDMSLGMPWGRAKFQVVAYYAPQFAELRRRCVAGGEAAFLASISRCRKWASRGGKSNVYFAKTRDDRYIVKQMSKSERQSFLEFAPDYFRYVATMLHKGRDTCLAKILGFFQVSVKYTNSAYVPFGAGAGARDGVIDLLITENLFYGRSISRIYDLKGSTRDRYVAENPAVAGAVFMDENLKEVNLSSPTLVLPHAYERLQKALWADTAFLSSLGVMDYSLLMGFDKRSQQLVVGVIDFIRQYTWDKQVETWVKKSGILGGAGKDPTVISPKQYSRRFRIAMSGYITVVPSLLPPPRPLDPDAV